MPRTGASPPGPGRDGRPRLVATESRRQGRSYSLGKHLPAVEEGRSSALPADERLDVENAVLFCAELREFGNARVRLERESVWKSGRLRFFRRPNQRGSAAP